MLTVLACISLQAQDFGILNDGYSHGDPPFLLEEGWIPMLNGKDLSGWHGQEGVRDDWFSTQGVLWEPMLGPTRLKATKEPGDRIVNGDGRTANLISDDRFGDVEIYLEFLIARGSNSGVYLQGLYEVQVFDSYGSEFPMSTSDGGAIYHRWINEAGVGGSAPRVNANGRPGEWQSYHIWFRAPRFDAQGRKTENARFLRVLQNGQLIQENVEVEGPTRAHLPIQEQPLNPIMLQGDHGPVAYRNIYLRQLSPIIKR